MHNDSYGSRWKQTRTHTHTCRNQLWPLYDLICNNLITNNVGSNKSGNQSFASPSSECNSFPSSLLEAVDDQKTTAADGEEAQQL